MTAICNECDRKLVDARSVATGACASCRYRWPLAKRTGAWQASACSSDTAESTQIQGIVWAPGERDPRRSPLCTAIDGGGWGDGPLPSSDPVPCTACGRPSDGPCPACDRPFCLACESSIVCGDCMHEGAKQLSELLP